MRWEGGDIRGERVDLLLLVVSDKILNCLDAERDKRVSKRNTRLRHERDEREEVIDGMLYRRRARWSSTDELVETAGVSIHGWKGEEIEERRDIPFVQCQE